MHALLIDGLNLIRRVHAGVPGEGETQHADAVLNACVASLRRALRRHQPSHALCALDGEGPSWRRDLFADYKKTAKAHAGRSALIVAAGDRTFRQAGSR
jgi:protein Xni